MLLRISLFHLLPDATPAQLGAGFSKGEGVQPLGIFASEGLVMFDAAELSLLDHPAVTTPPEAHWDPGKPALDLWLEPIPGLPMAPGPVQLTDRLLHVSFYEPHLERTEEEFVAFAQRTAPRYTDYMNEIGWQYVSTFRAHGFPRLARARLLVVDAPTIDEALARDAERSTPPDIALILQERRSLVNAQRQRPVLWLIPQALTPLGQQGLRI